MASFNGISSVVQNQISGPRPGTPSWDEWLQGRGVLEFLRDSLVQDVPVLIVTPTFYVCSVLVPVGGLPVDLTDASVHWYCNASRVWNIAAWRDRKTSEVSVDLYPPNTVTAAGKLDEAEPIVYLREFPRGLGEYIEADQKLYQSAGLHRMDSRSAYSRLNINGDFEDIIRYGPIVDGHICTVDASSLDQFMQATGRVLLRFFQVDRLANRDVWSTHDDEVERFDSDGFHGEQHRLMLDGQLGGTRLHGLQVIPGLGNCEGNLKVLLGEDDQNRKKATFTIPGSNAGTTRRWPPTPGEAREPVPDLITPVFFRPEVLAKYKADSEKYEVTQSTIECYGTWFLRSYDVNSEKQVYAYLKDLWELPYTEQLYWASFNEASRAGITERSWMQDFEAKRWPGHDDLHELEQLLRAFPAPDVQGTSLEIWTGSGLGKPGDLTVVRLHRPLTESGEDWARHILDLNKVVVEGIVKETLKKIAKVSGVEKDLLAKEGSLKLLERILRLKGVEDGDVEAVCGPLYEIYRWRSEGGVGHRGGSRPQGNLRAQYDLLIGQTYNAMKKLAELIEAGVFDVTENDKSVS